MDERKGDEAPVPTPAAAPDREAPALERLFEGQADPVEPRPDDEPASDDEPAREDAP